MNFKDVVYKDIATTEVPIPVITSVKEAKRQAIHINDIQAQRRIYGSETTHRTNEFSFVGTDRIAIFANEYIPNHFPNAEWVEYILTVNGKNYKIQPINSNKKGAKIIKYGKYNEENESIVAISETIKTARLEIKIYTHSELESPFVSNVKIVTGNEVVK